MDQPPANHRRWFRFSLRTLLVLVALAAVASWGYWVAWPWWKIRVEQRGFEAAIARRHAGISEIEFLQRLPLNDERFCRGSTWADSLEDPVSDRRYWEEFDWPNAIYIVWWRWTSVEADNWREHCTEIKAYRLPAPPIDYHATTDRARRESGGWIVDVSAEIPARLAYVFDFLTMTSRGNSIRTGFQYELIYSDPPARPAAK